VPNIFYGDIWFCDLDPTVGHEQAGQRPILVISPDKFNQSPLKLVLVLPITTNLRPLPSRVPMLPPEGGLTRPSIILCEALRSVSQQRLQHRLGTAAPATLQAVQDRLRILMNL
jgi:mRNA interferase MazF